MMYGMLETVRKKTRTKQPRGVISDCMTTGFYQATGANPKSTPRAHAADRNRALYRLVLLNGFKVIQQILLPVTLVSDFTQLGEGFFWGARLAFGSSQPV
jgi:hypothetical protein